MFWKKYREASSYEDRASRKPPALNAGF